MKKRHIVLSLLVSLSVITFLDRLCIAVSGPKIQEELGISPARWGWILGAFVFAYGIFEIPSGGLGDRFGQRKVLTRIALWWSAFTLLTGMATSFVMLLITQAPVWRGGSGRLPEYLRQYQAVDSSPRKSQGARICLGRKPHRRGARTAHGRSHSSSLGMARFLLDFRADRPGVGLPLACLVPGYRSRTAR